jgi:hypothetical protein
MLSSLEVEKELQKKVVDLLKKENELMKTRNELLKNPTSNRNKQPSN